MNQPASRQPNNRNILYCLPPVIIDTREQEPYSFPSPVRSIIETLETGDYSLKNYEDRITVERKSLQDFVNTVIHAKKRFTDELIRMSNIIAKGGSACIIIEADTEDVLNHKYRGEASPDAVFGLYISIIARWKIPVYFVGNRQIARKFVLDYLAHFYRGEVAKNGKNNDEK